MSRRMTHREDESEIDFDFVTTIRTRYPAIYKKNTKEYSDRDLTRNSWEGLCQRMGNISGTLSRSNTVLLQAKMMMFLSTRFIFYYTHDFKLQSKVQKFGGSDYRPNTIQRK